MQQHTRPARAEHDGHRASRRRNGLEIQQRLTRRFARKLQRAIACYELIQREAATGTCVALLATAVLLHEHGNIEAHQRTHVRGQLALTVRNEHDLVHGGDTRHHLHDARVELACLTIDTLEPRDLLLVLHRRGDVDGQIEAVARLGLPRLHATFAALRSDGASGTRRFLQRGQHDLVRVREAGLFARQRAHTDALLDAGAAVLHDAVFQRPRLFA